MSFESRLGCEEEEEADLLSRPVGMACGRLGSRSGVQEREQNQIDEMKATAKSEEGDRPTESMQERREQYE